MKKTTYICDITKKENLNENEVISLKLFTSSKLNPDIHASEDLKYEEQFDEYDLSLKGADILINYILKQLHGYDDKIYNEIVNFLSKKKKSESVKFSPQHGEKSD